MGVSGEYKLGKNISVFLNFVAVFGTHDRGESAPMETATAEAVVDRLEAVREYLGSLITRIESDGDTEVNAALVEALASIDMAATGV